MKKLGDFLAKDAFIYLPAFFALTFSLWYQLREFNTHIVFIFDSAHYLLASSQVLSILQACLAGRLSTVGTLSTEPSFVANIMLDGPIMPLIGALAFLISGQPALAKSWPIIVGVLSVLSALGAAAVAYMARSLTGNSKLALLVACIFAAYPTTIASTGRFLTEPVATFLLLGLAVTGSIVVCSRRSLVLIAVSLIAGLFTALGFLLKPALLPAWAALLVPAFFYRYRAKLPMLVPLLLASATVAVVLGSWLTYTKVATGTFYLMPQRQPASNVAQGHELETDGRGAMGFDSPTDKVSDSADSRSIFVNAWREHPQQISNLYLRKMTRTLGFAWNDFKQRVFALNIEQQDFLHALILALGLVGLPLMLLELCFGSGKDVCNFGRRYLLLVAPLLLLIHAFLYLPFESTVRYGAPALPFLLLSAAFAVSWLSSFGWQRLAIALGLILLMVLSIKCDVNFVWLQRMPLGQALLALTVLRVAALLLVFLYLALLLEKHRLFQSLGQKERKCTRIACVSTFVAFVVMPICATTLFVDNQRECRIELASGQQIVRDILLPLEQAQIANAHYLIYVDCDRRFAKARFFLNDVLVQGEPVEANKIDSASYFVFNIMRMYASIFDLPVDCMRQWRVLKVPTSLIRFGSNNRLSVVAGSEGLTVFADRFDAGEVAIRLPNKALFSASKMCNEGLELDGRVLERKSTKLWPICASFVAPGAKPEHLVYRQPRLYLLQSHSPSISTADAAFSAITPLALDRFDPVLMTAGGGNALKIDRYTMQLAKSTSLATALPPLFSSGGQVQITLRGKVRSIGRMNKIGIFVTLHGAEPSSPFMILPGCPPFIEANPQDTEFEIKDRIFLSSAPNRKYMISVGLFPGRWEQFSQYGIDHNVGSFLVKDLVLSVSKTDNIDLSIGTNTLY